MPTHEELPLGEHQEVPMTTRESKALEQGYTLSHKSNALIDWPENLADAAKMEAEDRFGIWRAQQIPENRGGFKRGPLFWTSFADPQSDVAELYSMAVEREFMRLRDAYLDRERRLDETVEE